MLSHIILIVQDVFDSSHMIFYSVKSRYKEFEKCREGEFEILCKNITLSKKNYIVIIQYYYKYAHCNANISVFYLQGLVYLFFVHQCILYISTGHWRVEDNVFPVFTFCFCIVSKCIWSFVTVRIYGFNLFYMFSQ